MAEGLLEGALGGEEEKPEAEAPEHLAGVEAFAAAIAAKLAGSDPGVARKTEEYLTDQSQLLKVQKRHLEEEHEARLHFLQGQAREVDLRRLGLRLRVGFQLFLVLVSTVIGISFLVLVHNAVTSRDVVIEPFEVPHMLAERGLTGTVIASGILDELRRLQAATRSTQQRRDLSSAWSKEITLTVPETGISIGEISQVLKARFSHDIHIGGEVAQTEAGALEITVRGDGIAAQTFTGAGTELKQLTTRAAERIYSQSQPGLWAPYLVDSGRYQEAIDFCQAAISSSSKSDQPNLLMHWAIALALSRGPGPEGLALARRAIALQPDYWEAYDVMSSYKQGLGDEEDAWMIGENQRRLAGGRPGRAPESTYFTHDSVSWELPAELAAFLLNSETASGTGTFEFSAGPQIALLYMWQHDPLSAELSLQMTRPDVRDPSIAAVTHAVRAMLAAESDDTARAVAEWEAYLSAYLNPAVAWPNYGLNCWAAPAEEAATHRDLADAVLKTGGTYVDCYRFHGGILDGRGDWKGAQEWYSKAIKLAPDLPAGYYSWGVALSKHGDLVGAAEKLAHANKNGPHWADPLKAWGDLLVKQGNTKDALDKYDEALKYAPNWKQLKEARQAIAKQKS